MSLRLDDPGTTPQNLVVKTFGHALDGNKVHLGQYEITLEDFLVAALYVLTNTELIGPEDPRMKFMDLVRSIQQVPGFEAGTSRLQVKS